MEWQWETQKKIWEKRVGKGSSSTTKWHKWHKLAQVEQVEQVEAGLQNCVEQVEQEQGGPQIPWNKWNKDKVSVQLNLSTWPNVELQGREKFAAVFATHFARTFRMLCGVLNQTHVANFHVAFGQLL